MEMSIQNNINFKAKPIALSKNILSASAKPISLYQLTADDKVFLKKLKKKVHISELMPNLPTKDAQNWQDVLDFTINSAMDKKIKKYIAFWGNKPCSIMSVQKTGDTLNLLGIASIPIGINKKAHHAGQTMFYQLMRLGQMFKSNSIELEAIKNSPFNLVKKYKDIGFNIVDKGDRYISMSCKNKDIHTSCKNIQKRIQFKLLPFKKDKNLNNMI